MLKCSFWKIPLLLFIALFLIAGCSAINDFMQEEMRGPSWDTNVRLPLIPTQEIKLVDILNENDQEYDDEDIFSFEFELDKMDFGLDEIELEDIDYDPIETTMPEIKIDFGEVFNGTIDPFGLAENTDITLDEKVPPVDLSDNFTTITIRQGTLDLFLAIDPEDNDLEFDIEIILFDNGQELAQGSSQFSDGTAHVEIDLAGTDLPNEIDLEFRITNPNQDYNGQLNYSVKMDSITIEKVTGLDEIDVEESLTLNLLADEFDENIKEIVMEEGKLILAPNIPDAWNIDFSIEKIYINDQELSPVSEGVFSIEGVVFNLEDSLEVKIDFRAAGTDVTYDTTETVDFNISLADLLWKEITVSGLLTDMEDFTIDEEIFATGLDELEEWLEGIGLAEEAITLILQVDNQTDFVLSSDLSLILLYTHEGTEEESVIEADDFNVDPREAKEIRFLSGEIPSMPHSIKIPESTLEIAIPEGEDDITITRADYFSMVGDADFKLKFLVQPGGVENDVATGKLELDTDDQDVLDGWIQNVLIDFYNANDLPLYLDITVFFSNDEENIFDQDNPNWTIGLPETGTAENYLVEISKDDLETFKEPAWYGIRVEILKDITEPQEIIFKYGDSFSTKANLDVEIRVNPHED